MENKMPNQDQITSLLIVDDNPKNIQVLGSILAKEGYKVYFAQNGLDALKKVQITRPDLILLDIIMPELDGFETCVRLKASPETQNIPVIFLTARTETEDIVKGFQLGAVDYVTKPFQKEEILVRIQTHLQLQQMQKQLEAQNTLLQQEIHERNLALEQAWNTQLALLPQIETNFSGIQLVAKYVPMDKIGGDFYDIVDLKDGKTGIFIADVTGHGVSAALLSSMISGLFRILSRGIDSPAKVMHRLNEMFYNKKPLDKFASALYCIYSKEKQSLTYTSAGHPYGYIIRPETRELLTLKQAQGTLLGIHSGSEGLFQEKTIPLLPGDKVFLYTDGITDIANPQNELFESRELERFLMKKASLSIQELIGEIYAHVLEFSGKEKFEDDITMVGFECERL